jgi:hypothetical protein
VVTLETPDENGSPAAPSGRKSWRCGSADVAAAEEPRHRDDGADATDAIGEAVVVHPRVAGIAKLDGCG